MVVRRLLYALLLPTVALAQSWQSVNLLQEPRPQPTQAPAFILAQQVSGSQLDQIQLKGNAQVRRADIVVKGPQITYHKPDLTIQGPGLINGYGLTVLGQQMRYNLDTHDGAIHQAHFYLASGGQGTADDFYFHEQETAKAIQAQYSSCGCVDRIWYIKAKEVDFNFVQNQAIAHHATLYIADTPVMWLPYFTAPLRKESTTGFLSPIFGLSTRSGFDVTIPYYVALAPNYDTTLSTRILSKRGTMLGVQGRYLDRQQQLTVDTAYLPHDRITRYSRWSLAWQYQRDLGRWYDMDVSLSTYGRRVSDDNFLRDFQQNNIGGNGIGGNGFYLPQYVGLRLHRKNIWDIRFFIQKYQALQDSSSSTIYGQYERIPELNIQGRYFNWHGFDITSTHQFTRFVYPTYQGPKAPYLSYVGGHQAPNGYRFSSYMTISHPVVRAGWFVTPKLGLHLSHYRTQWFTRYQSAWQQHFPHRPFPIHSQSGRYVAHVTRVLPIFSLDAGLRFQRHTNLLGIETLQSLEPRLFYVYIPYVNQDDIPVYDTSITPFDFDSVFQVNRYNGGWDRINSANQLTLGLNSHWYDKDDGQQRLAIQFAQRFYFRRNRVFLPDENKDYYGRSDTLLGLNVQLAKHLRIRYATQVRSQRFQVIASTAGLYWSPKRLTNVSVVYRYQRPPLHDDNETASIYQLPGKENLSVSLQWPFSRHLSMVGRFDYALNQERTTQLITGLEYKGNCCWAARFVAQHYLQGEKQRNSAIYLQIELQGLGAVGSNPIELLRQSIYGYTNIVPQKQQHSLFERYE